jgi:putative two-component system response regulator
MQYLFYLSASESVQDAFTNALDPVCDVRIASSPEAFCRQLVEVAVAGNYAGVLVIDEPAYKRFGSDMCQTLIARAREHALSSIMLIPEQAPQLKVTAANAGFDDTISAPFMTAVIDSKLRTHFRLQELSRRVDEQTDAMDHVMSELAVVQDAAILSLAAIARVRDHSTGNHILRTQHYVKALAEHLRYHPRFEAELDEDTIELLYKTAALHDIGKVAIPDSILQKPDRLTDDEFVIMKRHTLFGFRAMHTAEQLMDQKVGVQAARFLKIGQQVTLSHHERWDGLGYPQGLKGEAIPVVARLMEVADVYDAVSSRRPYKDALGHKAAARIIIDGRGTHFDPDVVDAFVDLADTFEHIAGVLEDRFPSLTDLTLHSMDELLPHELDQR